MRVDPFAARFRAACGGDDVAPPPDVDAGATDLGGAELGGADLGARDAGPLDAGVIEAFVCHDNDGDGYTDLACRSCGFSARARGA